LATKRAPRCPRTNLTHWQANVLALIAITGDPRTSRNEWPALTGVLRSLVARGLLSPGYTVTPEGWRALEHCNWFSRGMQKVFRQL